MSLSTEYAINLVQDYLRRLNIVKEPENPTFILQIMSEVAKDFLGRFAILSYCTQDTDGSETYTLPPNVDNVISVQLDGQTIQSKITEHEVAKLAETTI